MLATDDENERTLWVQAIYRATGQTHKPVPPVIQTNRISNTQISRMQGGKVTTSRQIKFEEPFPHILSSLNLITLNLNVVRSLFQRIHPIGWSIGSILTLKQSFPDLVKP